MKIFDCFPFAYELDVLEIRLNVLSDVVDYFVLVENEQTFTGLDKPFFYEINKKRFAKFADRIIHIPVGRIPPEVDPFIGHVPWMREYWQKNRFYHGLKDAHNDDIIIISDVDEIPSSEVVLEYKNKEIQDPRVVLGKMGIFKLDLLCFNDAFTVKERTEIPNVVLDDYWLWLGPVIQRKKTVKPFGYYGQGNLREQRPSLPMMYGGWHYTYMYDLNGIMLKNISFSHADSLGIPSINNPEYIHKCIKEKKEFTYCGRALKQIEMTLDNTPQYILDNKEKFKHILL